MRQRRIPRHRQCRHGRWPRSPSQRLLPAAAAIPRWPTAQSKRIARPPSPAGRHTAATDTTASPAAQDEATDPATATGQATSQVTATGQATGQATATGLATAMGRATAMGQATGTGTSPGRPVTVTGTPDQPGTRVVLAAPAALVLAAIGITAAGACCTSSARAVTAYHAARHQAQR